MIDFSEKDGKLTFKVQAVPRASSSEIMGEHNGALRIRLAAPPVDDAANHELVRMLSRALGLPKSRIEITAGHASRLKTVCVTGARPDVLNKLAQVKESTRNKTQVPKPFNELSNKST
jgi:uncharacterized protein